jgi:hypothetical protein
MYDEFFFEDIPDWFDDEETDWWEGIKDFENMKAHGSLYLPALSKKYTEHGMDEPELNFLKKDSGVIYYPYALQTFGQRSTKPTIIQPHNRDKDSYVLGDSGGYQILKGTKGWVFDWENDRTRADRIIEDTLGWYTDNCDEGMILDVPATTPQEDEQPTITTFEQCLDITLKNIKTTKAIGCKKPLLNVLQVFDTIEESDAWYDEVTKYKFSGWSFGGDNKTIYKVLYLLLRLKQDGLLEAGEGLNRVHILGVRNMDWSWYTTMLSNAWDVKFTFDSGSTSLDAGRFNAAYTIPDPVSHKIFSKSPSPYSDNAGLEYSVYDEFTIKDLCNRGLIGGLPMRKNKKGRTEYPDSIAGPALTNGDIQHSTEPHLYVNLHNIWASMLWLYGFNNIRNLGKRKIGKPGRQREAEEKHKKLWMKQDIIEEVLGSKDPINTLHTYKDALELKNDNYHG